MPKRRWQLTLLAVFALGTGCADGDTPTAEQVIENMLAATGSGRARSAVQSLTTTADCEGPDGAFETTVTSIRPDTVYFRQASHRGITEIWSTRERTWGGNAGEEYETMGQQVREFVRGQEFHLMLIDITARFSEFQLQGSEVVANADCFRVSMKDEAGRDASVCIRADDWLPAELRLDPASSPGPVRIAFDEWRPVGRLNLFHALEVSDGDGQVFSYNYVDVSVNTFAYEMRVPPPSLPRTRADEVE